jgi:Tol biopolymer transport system component
VDEVGMGPESAAAHFDPFPVEKRRDCLSSWRRPGQRAGLVRPKGNTSQFLGAARGVLGAHALPGGKRIAVGVVSPAGQADVLLLDSSEGTASRFTFSATTEATPMWSSDGRDIVFTWNDQAL